MRALPILSPRRQFTDRAFSGYNIGRRHPFYPYIKGRRCASTATGDAVRYDSASLNSGRSATYTGKSHYSRKEAKMAKKLSEQQMLEELKNFDTPSITNVVATYPTDPLCLGLYNPWTENWYTDTSIRCMYPELGRLVGYAVTCVYGLPDPNYNRLTFGDVIDALAASKQPTILVIQQDFPPEIANKVGLAGGNMVSAMKSIGCLGLISNGPSRDLDEVRPMGFQYMLSGVTAGHGAMAVRAVNVPVSVGGMDVAPGEIIHMDENGAVKFPAGKIEAVLANVRKLQQVEAERQSALQNAKSADEIRAIFGGHAYGDKKK